MTQLSSFSQHRVLSSVFALVCSLSTLTAFTHTTHNTQGFFTLWQDWEPLEIAHKVSLVYFVEGVRMNLSECSINTTGHQRRGSWLYSGNKELSLIHDLSAPLFSAIIRKLYKWLNFLKSSPGLHYSRLTFSKKDIETERQKP